ncbi:MAG: DUF5915 domain-containing protein, partial [Promethearchaeota archaeon]
LIDEIVLKEGEFLMTFVQDLRSLRDTVKIKIRQPIKEYLLCLKKEEKAIVQKYNNLIKNELNVKELNFISEKKAKSLYYEKIVLNNGAIGRDFKKDRLKVEKLLETMDLNEIKRNFAKGKLTIGSKGNIFEITKQHFQIEQIANEPYAVKILGYGTILINSKLDKQLLLEGFAREFIRNIQNIRKKLNLSRFKEKIIINVKSDINLEKELEEFIEVVKDETGCVKISRENKGKPFSFKIQNKEINLLIEIKN